MPLARERRSPRCGTLFEAVAPGLVLHHLDATHSLEVPWHRDEVLDFELHEGLGAAPARTKESSVVPGSSAFPLVLETLLGLHLLELVALLLHHVLLHQPAPQPPQPHRRHQPQLVAAAVPSSSTGSLGPPLHPGVLHL